MRIVCLCIFVRTFAHALWLHVMYALLRTFFSSHVLFILLCAYLHILCTFHARFCTLFAYICTHFSRTFTYIFCAHLHTFLRTFAHIFRAHSLTFSRTFAHIFSRTFTHIFTYICIHFCALSHTFYAHFAPVTLPSTYLIAITLPCT